MYLKMYLGGNEKKVWDEIEALKISELNEEKLKEVTDVCNETMRRVKVNIERIVEVLKSLNYDFSKYPDGQEHFFDSVLEGPDPDVEAKIKHIESIAGVLPFTVKAFWRTVGSTCLVGYREGWPEFSDQLVVASVEDNVETIEDWRDFRKECGDHSEDPFILFLSPDDSQKDNYEGGQYYNVELPCETVDGSVQDAPSETSFIDFLRDAFEGKGFPGIEEGLPQELEDLELLNI